MLTRFLQRLSLSTFVCLLLPATAGVAMAGTPGQAHEGKIEAIEIYRTSDNAHLGAALIVLAVRAHFSACRPQATLR